MGFLVWIIVIIVFLAIVGLGWNTFFSGVKKGADKIGITTIVENVTDNAVDIVRNASQASQDIIANSLKDDT
jgi:acylphosphatase